MNRQPPAIHVEWQGAWGNTTPGAETGFYRDLKLGRWAFCDMEYRIYDAYNDHQVTGQCIPSGGSLWHWFGAGDLRTENGVEVVTILDPLADGRCSSSCSGSSRGCRVAGGVGPPGTGHQTIPLSRLKLCMESRAGTNKASYYTVRPMGLIDETPPPPAGSILSATAASSAVITVTAHGYSIGEYIAITGSNAVFNGTWRVDAVATNTMTIAANNVGGSTNPGGVVNRGSAPPPPPGTITAATAASPVVLTVTAHGYQVADYVRITGSSTAGLNGNWRVDARATNTITIAYVNTGGSTTPGGTVTRGTAPAGVITLATAANPVIITVAAHGFEVSDYILITGSSIAALNATWEVTARTTSTMTLGYDNSAGSTNPGGSVSQGQQPAPVYAADPAPRDPCAEQGGQQG